MANKYPTVLIHGFFGFGESDMLDKFMHYWGFRPDRNVAKYLRKQGYEIFYPSLGPFNSSWDRSCILYAYLFGGRVDYGKVHSEKYGHARYGRTYPGVLKDWGKPGHHEKINIVGHSFGGPTVITLANLLTRGNAEEIAGTPPEELSPLFKGGQGDLLHTVTTLSGVNNGTTLASGLLRSHGNTVASYIMLMIMTALGKSELALKFWDFYMEHWGIMPEKKDVHGNHLTNPRNYVKEMDRFCENWFDAIGNEMKLQVRYEMNDRAVVNPNTYYFARLAERSAPMKKNPENLKCSKDAGIIAKFGGLYTGRYWDDELTALTGGQGKKEWMPHDGFVNVLGQMAPFTLPSEKADNYTGPFNSGIWYNMPVEHKDHLSWVGWKEKKDVFYKYYLDMMELFDNLPAKSSK